MSRSVVMEPGTRFAALDAVLTSLGFHRDPSVRSMTPEIIPGEPELAAWTRGGGGERLTYTFNPVVSLRVLAHIGAEEAATGRLAGALPLLDTAAIGQLLAETAPRLILLGLFAARVLVARELAAQVAALRAHADATIRSAARTTSEVFAAGGEAEGALALK